MKKIFGISLVSILTAMPMMAGAAVTDADPGATVTENAAVASAAPKYALKQAGDNDAKAATAGYVKGAYNAIIKGINKTKDEVDTLNTDIGTYQGAIGHLLDGKATQDGTVATIKSATSNEAIQTSSVNITGVTTSSISATASGTVNLSLPVKNDWESDTVAENPVQTATTFSGLNVDDISMSAPGANNTATLTKSNIGGTVDVAEYLVPLPPFDYTQLINSVVSSYSTRGTASNSYNAGDYAGLEPGEWTVTWNDYGTVKGTSMCSSTYVGSAGTTTTEPLSTSGETQYCWCKMTGFTDNDGNQYNQSSLWVFNRQYGSASGCATECTYHCGVDVSNILDVRSGILNSIQQ